MRFYGIRPDDSKSDVRGEYAMFAEIQYSIYFAGEHRHCAGGKFNDLRCRDDCLCRDRCFFEDIQKFPVDIIRRTKFAPGFKSTAFARKNEFAVKYSFRRKSFECKRKRFAFASGLAVIPDDNPQIPVVYCCNDTMFTAFFCIKTASELFAGKL